MDNGKLAESPRDRHLGRVPKRAAGATQAVGAPRSSRVIGGFPILVERIGPAVPEARVGQVAP
jgi:hypothetical protein